MVAQLSSNTVERDVAEHFVRHGQLVLLEPNVPHRIPNHLLEANDTKMVQNIITENLHWRPDEQLLEDGGAREARVATDRPNPIPLQTETIKFSF